MSTAKRGPEPDPKVGNVEPAGEGIRLTPLHSVSLKEQATQELKRLIDEGFLRPGQRLPSERELSDQLGVSRGTVREAVQFLRALGLVEIRHGAGTFVTGHDADALGVEWRRWTARHVTRIHELIELRKGIEALAAELASVRRTPTGLETMVKAIERMQAAADASDVTALVQADVMFHHGLAEASGNQALLELVTLIGDRLVPERAAVLDMEDRSERSLKECREVYEAVNAGDPARARAGIIRHLDSVASSISKLVAEPES